MTAANRYWLYGGDQQPDGQSAHELLGQFPTLISATAAAREWMSQRRDPAGKWWHVVDGITGKLVAESDCRPYGAPEREAKP